MSLQSQITVAGITPPAIGKKQGKIIDSLGNSWNVWGDKLHLYAMGQTYNITYEVNEFNNKQFNVIKTVSPASGQPQPQRAVAQPPAQPQPPVGIQLSAKDEMIFVCGIMNNSVGNSNVNPFELTTAELIGMMQKAQQVWRNTMGKQARGDMDDEIPF